MFFYCFRDRDRVLDLFEMSTGQRMHTRYFQVGGVFEDIPVGFERKLRAFCAEMPSRIDQYEAILNRNEILLQRLRPTGKALLSELLSGLKPVDAARVFLLVLFSAHSGELVINQDENAEDALVVSVGQLS